MFNNEYERLNRFFIPGTKCYEAPLNAFLDGVLSKASLLAS